MAEKILNTRIVNKHDTEAHWLLATGFTPKQGELIVYDIDENYNYERIKIGDGTQNVNALPFVDEALRTYLLEQIGAVDDRVDAVSVLVGEISVSEQIDAAAINNQSDWNVNDETSPAYIKNRPFYTESGQVTIIEEQTIIIDEDGGYATLHSSMGEPFNEGRTYFVTLNGVEYECVAWRGDESGYCIGNGDIYGGEGKGGDEPFICDSYEDGECYFNAQTAGTYTISIVGDGNYAHKIDAKYLPDIVGAYGQADGAEVFNDYENNIASDSCAHAEGYQTTASAPCTHAEGCSTVASDSYAHAEGYETEASGYASHAEGTNTKATGAFSHAEGSSTTASGDCAHTEGGSTVASGVFSHAEGEKTIAAGYAQHVEGCCNVEDSESEYLHIVGNGRTQSDRSNAHTIDWEGNAWFAGDVYVGSTSETNKDAGSKKLATEAYVSEMVAGIEIPDTNEHIETHNVSETAHGDIRALINSLSQLVAGKANVTKTTSITLSAENWVGDGNPWHQVVTVNGVTANSRVDLRATALQIVELQDNDIAFIAENDNGVVTVYALGSKPTVDYTVQTEITEVAVV